MDRYLSLSQELHLLADAMHGARLLADQIQHEQSAHVLDERLAARGIAALARLVTHRLQMLERVVTGELDPALLLAPHNQVDAPRPDEGEDVRLMWSRAQRLSRAREALASAEYAMQRDP